MSYIKRSVDDFLDDVKDAINEIDYTFNELDSDLQEEISDVIDIERLVEVFIEVIDWIEEADAEERAGMESDLDSAAERTGFDISNIRRRLEDIKTDDNESQIDDLISNLNDLQSELSTSYDVAWALEDQEDY